MKRNNTSQKLETIHRSGGLVKTRCSVSPDVATRYELMLRLYLISKEQASVKKLKYAGLLKGKSLDKNEVHSLEGWSSMLQVIQTAYQLIAQLHGSSIEMVTK